MGALTTYLENALNIMRHASNRPRFEFSEVQNYLAQARVPTYLVDVGQEREILVCELGEYSSNLRAVMFGARYDEVKIDVVYGASEESLKMSELMPNLTAPKTLVEAVLWFAKLYDNCEFTQGVEILRDY